MKKKIKFGFLIPHFGSIASSEKITSTCKLAEEYNFDSAWARDHLVFGPHAHEDSDKTFLEPFTVLGHVASVAKKLELGTAVINPQRHPVHLAQQWASLDYLCDAGVICGIGTGSYPREFLERPFDDREQLVKENVEIMKSIWTGESTEYKGEIFDIEYAEIYPRPKKSIPIWSGGSTPASPNRAVEYCDGWLPGRINLKTWDVAVRSMQKKADDMGREMPTLGVIPDVSPAKDMKTAVEMADIDNLLKLANKRKYWKRPEKGSFETVEDLEGLVMAGTSEDIVQEISKYVDHEIGIDHIVFDLRQRFSDMEYCIETIGGEVIPEFK